MLSHSQFIFGSLDAPKIGPFLADNVSYIFNVGEIYGLKLRDINLPGIGFPYLYIHTNLGSLSLVTAFVLLHYLFQLHNCLAGHFQCYFGHRLCRRLTNRRHLFMNPLGDIVMPIIAIP